MNINYTSDYVNNFMVSTFGKLNSWTLFYKTL